MAAPVVLSAFANDPHTIQVRFNQLLDVNSVPNAAAFSLNDTFLGGQPAPTVVNVFGDSVFLRTSDVSSLTAMKLAYALSGAPIQNLADEHVAIFNNLAVANQTQANRPPLPIGLTVNAATLYLYFDEVIDPASMPAAGAFAIAAQNQVFTPSALNSSGVRLAMTLTPTPGAGDEVRLQYTDPGTGNSPLQDLTSAINVIANRVASIVIPAVAANLSPAAGYYAGQSDIEDWFGIDNVASWSQLDNNLATADETRIARALAYADRQIDRELRTAGYTTPIATSSADFKLLTDIAAEMAGVWLYLARGKQDLGGGETGAAMAGKMDDHRKHADDELTDLIADGIDGASRFSDTSGAPLQIVAPDSSLTGLAADGLPLGWCG